MGRKRTWKRKYLYFCLASLTFLPVLNCTTSEGLRERSEAREYLRSSQKLLAKGDYEGSLLENLDVLSLPANRSYPDEALLNMGLIYVHFWNPNRDYKKSIGYFKKLIQDYPQNSLAEEARIWVRILQEMDELNQVIEKSNRMIESSKQESERSHQIIESSRQEIERLKASKQPVLKVEEPRSPKIDERPTPKVDKQAEARESLLRTQELLAQGDFDRALKENERLLAFRSLEDEALFNMGMIYVHLGNPKKDSVKSLGFLKKLIKDYPQSPWSDRAKVLLGVFQENEKLTQDIEKLRQVIERSKQVDIEIEEKRREKTK